jgi:hypothetical protein
MGLDPLARQVFKRSAVAAAGRGGVLMDGARSLKGVDGRMAAGADGCEQIPDQAMCCAAHLRAKR